jgi:hypothetical protein
VLTDTILKGDYPRIISAKFGWDSRKCPNLNCISIMMSFLTYIMDFLWTLNFCLFWPIMQIRKKGGWNKKKNLFEEISIYSNGGHLGYKMVLTDTILKGDYPRIISAKFGWDWLSSFRGEDFFLISSPLFSNLHNRSK